MKTLVRLRANAYKSQGRRCYYCEALMWIKDPSHHVAAFGIRPKAALLFKCTAEHLHARRDGGKDAPDNVVAACWFCNSRRHRGKSPPSPDNYKVIVTKAVREQTWPTSRAVPSDSGSFKSYL